MKPTNIFFVFFCYSLTLIVILAVHYYQILQEKEYQNIQNTVSTFKYITRDAIHHEYHKLTISEIIEHNNLENYSYQIFLEANNTSNIKQNILKADTGYFFSLPLKPTRQNLTLPSYYTLLDNRLMGWVKLQNGHLLSIHLVHRPASMSVDKIQFWLPLLISIFCWIIAGLYLLKHVSFWHTSLKYAKELTRPNTKIQKFNTYSPLQFDEKLIPSNFMILANAMSRANYQLNHKQRKIDTLVKRLERLVHNAPLPMIFIRKDGKLNFINEKFKSLFFVSLESTSKYYLTDFVQGKNDKNQYILEHLDSQKISRSILVKHIANNQIYQLHVMPWLSENGQIQGFTAVLSNINIIYQELSHTTKELILKSSKVAEFDQIWSVMGHELRTPLSGIIGMLDLLHADNLDKEQVETFDTLKQTSQTMLQMLNDMLDLAKMDAGKLNISEGKTDVLLMCRQICELMVGNARRQGIELLFFYELDTIRYINTDEARLRQILLNLIGNAIKFTQSGHVALRVSVKELIQETSKQSENKKSANIQMYFEIIDTGIGISEDEKKRLFSYFGQANSSVSSKFGGTGLGLAISKNFAKLLGGNVGMTSEIGHGSTFYVSLPIELKYPQLVYQYQSDFSKVALIYISSNSMSTEYINKLCNYYQISCVLEESLNHESISRINQWLEIEDNQRLNPVLFVDYEVLQKNKQLLTNKNPDDIFATLRNADTTPKILISMTPERSIPNILMDKFQGYIHKPLDISYFISELLRLGSKQASLSRVSKLQMSFDEFIETIDDDNGQIEKSVGIFNNSDNKPNNNLANQSEQIPTQTKLILVAEDNPINQKVAVKLLGKMGYRTITANNGEEAIKLLSANRDDIKLILMDCRMPTLDGLTATQQIRKKGDSIPIIALTANDTDEDRKACLHAGMDNFLSKPIKRDALQLLLNQYSI